MNKKEEFSPFDWMEQLYLSERETVIGIVDRFDEKDDFVAEMRDSSPFLADDDRATLFDYFQVSANYMLWL